MRRAAVSLPLVWALWALIVAGQLPPSSHQLRADTRKDAAPEPKVKVGDPTPDFTLKDQNRNDVALKDFRGKKNVVLAFYIFAFTGG